MCTVGGLDLMCTVGGGLDLMCTVGGIRPDVYCWRD